MKNAWIWILLAGGVVVAFFLLKKKPADATSKTAQATTAGTTTGKSPNANNNKAGGAASGQGSGWLGYTQNVLSNTSSGIKSANDAGAAIRSLGAFAGLWAGGGGSPSAQTSGSGAGVPINYDNPDANTRANDPSGGQSTSQDFSSNNQVDTSGSGSIDTSGFDSSVNDYAW